MDTILILAFIGGMLALTLAVLLACTERPSIAYWSFIGGMCILAAESILAGLTSGAGRPERMVYWQNWRMLATAFLPVPWLVFSISFARGNSREALFRWKFVLSAAAVIPILILAGIGQPLVVLWHQSAGSPNWILEFGNGGLAVAAVFLLSAIMVVINLERTFRAAAGTLRRRLKYTILGLGLLFIVRVYSASQELLFRGTTISLQAINSDALLVASLLIGFSLFRTGQLELKVYPSQFVLHQSMAAMFAAIYVSLILVLLRLVNHLTGTRVFAVQICLLLLALVLLAILLCSEKVRLRARQFVCRHFQRPQYDYRAVWRAFAECTARQIDQKELCAAIVKFVSNLFQTLSVTIWLTEEDEKHFVFGSSTSLTATGAAGLKLGTAASRQVILALRSSPEPTDVDLSAENWIMHLRSLHPVQPRSGGDRICAPLVVRGRVVGVMMLGDRVGGAPFSAQDYELLKSVSDQAAASLLNIELAQGLAQARQLEAFQSMSAFFVHDLKNTASTLSLMLQNLPVHFDKPAFREDALRGVSKTVNHINDLIHRLGLLRQELAVQPIEADLNSLIAEALKGIGQLPTAKVVTELQPVPKIRVDPLQIRNMVTNLVLNARDALKPGGEIRVETTRENGWVVLGVADDGCGMSPDFKNCMLFRPFQTTKKKGIGIGMFQCKMIVEAHHGKIEVESELGKGTAFRIFLPVD